MYKLMSNGYLTHSKGHQLEENKVFRPTFLPQ